MSDDHARMAQQAQESGRVALWRALQPLRSVSCWLQLGAHPDDEWNGFLAWLGLGHGLRTVYACALRGEGGQNALGPETGHALGVLRSREMMLAAAEIGCALRFLNAGEADSLTDFGFSRTGVDTLARWGAARLERALVRVIREIRPEVVSTTFLDVPGQHGHHRAVTAGTWRAVDLAADPAYVLPDGDLPAWQVAKTYLPAFSGASASYDDREPPPPATVTVELGEACAALGGTWAQIGERSRRMHASQGMGRRLPAGPRPLALHQRSGTPDAGSPLDGLAHRLGELADLAPLHAADAAVDAALAAFPGAPAVADALHAALGALAALGTTGDAELDRKVALRRRQLGVAAGRALGLPMVLAVPAAPWRAGARVAIGGLPAGATLLAPPDWRVAAGADGTVVQIPADAAPFGSNRPGYDPLGGNEPVGAVLSWTHAGSAAELRLDPPDPVMLAPAQAVRIDPAAIAVPRGGRPVLRLSGAAAPAEWGGEAADAGIALPPMPGRRRLVVPGGRLALFRHAHTGLLGRPVAAAAAIHDFDIAVDARAKIAVLEGATAGLGAWLRQVGIDAQDVADPAALAAGGHGCVLVGHFGFARHPALAAGIARLMAWVAQGGRLVTLYHRPQDCWPGAPHLPIEIGVPSFRWRVTRPDAPVSVLAPGHPLLGWPNAIGAADWAGWVHERGLYFASSWHADYRPLLATGDPGEAALQGGLLVRRIGRGQHVHVALALHRQLPALVPGAFRLLANLLAGERENSSQYATQIEPIGP